MKRRELLQALPGVGLGLGAIGLRSPLARAQETVAPRRLLVIRTVPLAVRERSDPPEGPRDVQTVGAGSGALPQESWSAPLAPPMHTVTI